MSPQERRFGSLSDMLATSFALAWAEVMRHKPDTPRRRSRHNDKIASLVAEGYRAENFNVGVPVRALLRLPRPQRGEERSQMDDGNRLSVLLGGEREHRNSSPWFDGSVRVSFEEHPTRREALSVERDAIRAEMPRMNSARCKAPLSANAKRVFRMREGRRLGLVHVSGWVPADKADAVQELFVDLV